MSHCEACYDLGAECECDRHSKTPSTTSKPVEELKVIEYPDGFRFGNGDDIIVSSEILHEYIQKQVLEGRIDEVKLMKNFVHAETKRGGSAVYGFNKAVGYFRFKADERIDALQTNNKESRL